MHSYDQMSAKDFSRILPYTAEKACLQLDGKWKGSDHMYLDYSGAEFLYWQYQTVDGEHILCEMQKTDRSNKFGPIKEYRLTKMGLKVKKILSKLEKDDG